MLNCFFKEYKTRKTRAFLRPWSSGILESTGSVIDNVVNQKRSYIFLELAFIAY